MEETEAKSPYNHEQNDPATPSRRILLPERYEEASPTDTTFSGHSIFDPPEDRHEPGTPTRQGRYRDDASDTTSCDGDDEDVFGSSSGKIDSQEDSTSLRLRPASLHSHDPALTDDGEQKLDQLPTISEQLPPRDPNEPRIVNIVSCLQCTLANLPCSRSTPSCTRCTRNGKPNACLLLRRRFHEEINVADPEFCTLPVLLKRKYHSEENWETKLQAVKELQVEWDELQDKRNWVLPKVDSEKRGDWWACGYVVKKAHPGEGLGRVRYEELVVDFGVDGGLVREAFGIAILRGAFQWQ